MPPPPAKPTNVPNIQHILIRLVIAAASGLLLAAAFPALDWGFLGLVALVPLLCLLRCCSWPAGAAYGLVTGFVFFFCLLYYISQFGLLPWVALALFQAAYFALAGAGIAALRRCPPGVLWPLAAAAVWTLTTYLRGNVGPLSLPFGELGHTQHAALSIAQAASVVGALGLTFLLALLNAAIAQLVAVSAGQPDAPAGAVRASIAVGVFLLLVMLAGIARFHVAKDTLRSESGPWVPVAAVQAEIYAGREPDVGIGLEAAQAYVELSTRRQPAARADLIVWPETALVVDPDRDLRFRAAVDETIARTHAHLLFGHLRIADDGRIYNAASLLAPDGRRLGEYHKVHLVLFGEYVPYRKQFPVLARFPVRDYDLTAGDRWMTLDAKSFRAGPLICFESLFPGMSREVVRQGADLLVIITSDAWAGRTAELWQHGYVSVFRAIEQNRFLIRAGTQGLTCIISPYGEIIAQVDPFAQGVAAASVHPIHTRTFYSRHGDWPLFLLCGILLVLAMLAARATPPVPA
jgi:apolipoprotein N-acyltransferase